MNRNRKLLYTRNNVARIAIPKEILIFSLLLILGILIGVFTAKNGNSNILTQVKNMFDSFYSIRENQSIILSACNSLKVSGVFWIINLIFGMCIIGIPFVSVIPTIRGLGIGLVTGYIYSIYGLKGIGYCFLVIFPGALISFIALIYSVSDSFKMSLCTLGVSLNTGTQKGGADKIKIFIIRQIFYLILFVIAAFVDGITNNLFAGIFNF